MKKSVIKITAALLALTASLWAEPSARGGYLTDADVEKIKKHWADYTYASRVVGVPVEILPAIHHRESNLNPSWYSQARKSLVKNVGGPFMLDLGPKDNGAEFSRRIRAHERKIFLVYGGKGIAPKVSESFRFAAVCAAHELKSKRRLGIPWTYGNLADAVWGYNGRSGLTDFHSNAYVWNDPLKGRRLTVKYRDHHGKMVSFKDTRPGVMTLYGEIYRLRASGAFNKGKP